MAEAIGRPGGGSIWRDGSEQRGHPTPPRTSLIAAPAGEFETEKSDVGLDEYETRAATTSPCACWPGPSA